MGKNKIKELLENKLEILKNKKVIALAGLGLIAVIGLGSLGFMMANDKEQSSDKVVAEKTTTENNISKEEKEIEEQKEDLDEVKEVKEVDTSNSSEEENNGAEEPKVNIDNKSEDKETSVVKDTSTSNKVENTSTSTTNTSTSKPNQNSNVNTNTNTHKHNWVEVYKDVYHAEEGHYENVLVKDAWTESVPVYEEQYRAICNTCGADITENEGSHIRNHMLNGENGSYKNVPMQVQVGTNTINHDAVYENRWVVDKEAWTEKVVSGYKCSSCGATK